MTKLTPQLLKHLEDVFEELGYSIRYEKGNFKSGYCLLESRKLILLNKYSVIETRIVTLMEILEHLSKNEELENEKLTEFRKKHFNSLKKNPEKEEV